jgi:hypothetical protein
MEDRAEGDLRDGWLVASWQSEDVEDMPKTEDRLQVEDWLRVDNKAPRFRSNVTEGIERPAGSGD